MPPEQADGTVVFAVSPGNVTVGIDGALSQEAGWMLTGRAGESRISDWQFVLQAALKSLPGD